MIVNGESQTTSEITGEQYLLVMWHSIFRRLTTISEYRLLILIIIIINGNVGCVLVTFGIWQMGLVQSQPAVNQCHKVFPAINFSD